MFIMSGEDVIYFNASTQDGIQIRASVGVGYVDTVEMVLMSIM